MAAVKSQSHFMFSEIPVLKNPVLSMFKVERLLMYSTFAKLNKKSVSDFTVEL